MSVSASALGMPAQTLLPLQPGAKNAMDSAQIVQQKNSQLQNELTKTGGRRRRFSQRQKRRRSRQRQTRRRFSQRKIKRRVNTTSCRRCPCCQCTCIKCTGKRRGGATTTVPYVSTNGVPDGGATASNMKAITSAMATQNIQSGYDACVGQGPACTAQVAAQQQQLLQSK